MFVKSGASAHCVDGDCAGVIAGTGNIKNCARVGDAEAFKRSANNNSERGALKYKDLVVAIHGGPSHTCSPYSSPHTNDHNPSRRCVNRMTQGPKYYRQRCPLWVNSGLMHCNMIGAKRKTASRRPSETDRSTNLNLEVASWRLPRLALSGHAVES
jgi:hypothetical protein